MIYSVKAYIMDFYHIGRETPSPLGGRISTLFKNCAGFCRRTTRVLIDEVLVNLK